MAPICAARRLPITVRLQLTALTGIPQVLIDLPLITLM